MLLLLLAAACLASTAALEKLDETFSYTNHLKQNKENYDIKGRDAIVKPWPFGPVPSCSAKVVPDHDNFIANRIAGNWSFHTPMTNFLKAASPDPNLRAAYEEAEQAEDVVLTFTNKPDALKVLTEDKCVFLKETKRNVYAAGTFGIHSKHHGHHLFPYVLIDHHGVSVVVYWPTEGPTAIPMLVQMAPGLTNDHDLLILGENEVGKPFGLLHRMGVKVPGASPGVEEVGEAMTKSIDTQEKEEFNIEKFILEQGLHKSVEPVAEPEPLKAVVVAAEPVAEPEPQALKAAVLAAEPLKPVVLAADPMVDPVVKMLVEVEEAKDMMEAAEEMESMDKMEPSVVVE